MAILVHLKFLSFQVNFFRQISSEQKYNYILLAENGMNELCRIEVDQPLLHQPQPFLLAPTCSFNRSNQEGERSRPSRLVSIRPERLNTPFKTKCRSIVFYILLAFLCFVQIMAFPGPTMHNGVNKA